MIQVPLIIFLLEKSLFVILNLRRQYRNTKRVMKACDMKKKKKKKKEVNARKIVCDIPTKRLKLLSSF